MSPLTDCHACLLWLQSKNGTAMLTSGGKRVSWDSAADATTNNNPPITSTLGFYVTLTAELADDISLRHIILFFNFIKFTNPNPNPNALHLHSPQVKPPPGKACKINPNWDSR